MARPLIAPLAPQIVMHSGYVARLIAVDATTGNPVNGVVVKSVAMQVDVADAAEPPEKISIIPPSLTYSATRA